MYMVYLVITNSCEKINVWTHLVEFNFYFSILDQKRSFYSLKVRNVNLIIKGKKGN